MKKILSAALCLLLLLTVFSGCEKPPFFGGDSEVSSSAVSVSEPEAEPAGPYRIGLLQYEENPSQDEVREAFMRRLEEWGYDEERLVIEYENAGGDEAKAKAACGKFQKDGASIIVAVSAPAAEAAAKDGTLTVISVGGEGSTLEVKSGVQQTLSLAAQIDPELKTVGLLTNGGNEAAKEEVKVYCEAHELELVEASFDAAGGSVTKAIEELSGKVDALYTLPGTVTESVGTEAARAAKEKKLAWYAGDGFLVKLGALAAETADLTAVGYEAADLAVQLMVGEPLQEPAPFEASCAVLNQSTIDALAVTVPEELLERAALFSSQPQT